MGNALDICVVYFSGTISEQTGRFFIRPSGLLSTQSVRNKKPPAWQVDSGRIYKKCVPSAIIEIVEVTVIERKGRKWQRSTILSRTLSIIQDTISFSPLVSP